MKEIWKDIKDYEGLYQVSNLGNVKGLRKNIILSPSNGEYKQVTLCYKGKRKTIAVHRLVADAFIENPFNKTHINHKDENKHNNNANNLEWCTHKENMNYGSKQDRESQVKAKYNVLQYDLYGKLVKKWSSLREIILNTNYKKSNIMYCCEHKYKTAYGYRWEYLLIDSK